VVVSADAATTGRFWRQKEQLQLGAAAATRRALSETYWRLEPSAGAGGAMGRVYFKSFEPLNLTVYRWTSLQSGGGAPRPGVVNPSWWRVPLSLSGYWVLGKQLASIAHRFPFIQAL
jgi:hypothetical protein